MKLTDQELYELVNSKERYMALPVVFCHPVNIAPDDPALAESLRQYNQNWESYRNDHVEFWDSYPSSGKVFGDFDGRHVWRNIHTGKEMVTVTIGEGQWSGWVVRPVWDEWQIYFMSPFFLRDDRLYSEHYVLCDNLTAEQVHAWEVFRMATTAEREAYRHQKDGVQIAMF
jgi:hypothetical protein